ncbi:MAG: hypothetical protein FJ399_00400 [Verrucomicrobia bacterium]|nr:hypothetical protein [Verrucomicrobiota bacterium]
MKLPFSLSSATLADFTPLSAQAQIAIVSVLGLALLVLAIRNHVRRQPPLDSELVKITIAIEGLQSAVATLNESVREQAGHAAEILALQTKVRDLETKREEDLRAQRSYTRETTRELFEKLDDVKTSLSANFQSVENRLGRVDGALEQLTAQINRTRPPFD